MHPPPSQRRKLDVAPIAELPDQIIYSILLKLPMETLIKFCRLSKRWRETITSSTFAKQQMKSVRESTSTAASSCNVLYSVGARYQGYEHHFLSCRISSVEYGRQLVRPVKIPRFRFEQDFDRFRFKLSRCQTCDGLLCMSVMGDDVKTSCIHIFNPATGKDRNLIWPPLLDNMSHNYLHSFLGFGYDPSIDDYKIAILIAEKNGKLRVQITSLRENTWRTVDINTALPYMSLLQIGYHNFGCGYGWNSAYMNGCVYWIVYQTEDNKNHYFILKFNLSEERFNVLLLPEETGETDFTGKHRILVTLNESLFFFIWSNENCARNQQGWLIGETLNIDVWKLHEDTTWSKVFIIPTLEYGPRHLLHPVGFNVSGHVIMVDRVDSSLVFYIPQENRFVKLTDSVDVGVHRKTIGFHFVDMETLVSP